MPLTAEQERSEELETGLEEHQRSVGTVLALLVIIISMLSICISMLLIAQTYL